MIPDTYKQLSEDAQKLICYYAYTGYGLEKRMDDQITILTNTCFPSLRGEEALQELIDMGLIVNASRDWLTNAVNYEIEENSFVSALWYLFTERKDLLYSLRKTKDMRNAEYMELRTSIELLSVTDSEMCEYASTIPAWQAKHLCCMADDVAFKALLEKLPPETFAALYNALPCYWTEYDIAADISVPLSVLVNYNTITEAARNKFIADFELYSYIAFGQMPGKGLYSNISSGYTLGGLHAIYSGKATEAVKWFDAALKLQVTEKGEKGFFTNPLLTLYLVIAYIAAAADTNASNEKVVAVCQERLKGLTSALVAKRDSRYTPALVLAEDFCKINQRLHKNTIQTLYDENNKPHRPALFRELSYLLANLLGFSTINMSSAQSTPHLAMLRFEMSKYLPLDSEDKQQLYRRFGMEPILPQLPHEEEWRMILDDLMVSADRGTSPSATSRIIYLIDPQKPNAIQVREQVRQKDGGWSNGKRINDIRYKTGQIDFMNNTDRRIFDKFTRSMKTELTLEDVVEEMANDHRLYLGSYPPFEQVEVTIDRPYLVVENDGEKFVVKSNVPLDSTKRDIIINEYSPTSLSVIRIPNDIRDYYIKLLQLGSLPLEAEDALRSLLKKIGGKVELHSSLIEGGSTLPLTDGTWSIGFRLVSKNNGTWEVRNFVKPLPNGRHIFTPAKGNEIIIDENEEGRYRVKRNLPMEASNLEMVEAFYNSFGHDYEERGLYAPDFVINLMMLIQEHPDMFFAEWPEGQSFKVRGMRSGSGTWSGTMRQRGQWFDIEGDVDIDENTRISIKELLELASHSEGRYLKISDDEFVVISEKLHKQLDALNAIVNRENGGLKISPFSAALINNDVLHGVIEFGIDKNLSEARQRIIEASEYSPEVPKTLNATLRHYQLDGYHWMARLNRWGAGALLADDMGLGKTLQSIAFLLLQKEHGPSLVVAPASVVPNWKSEIERFAPSLNVQILNFAQDRKEVIDNAGPSDVVVTTYGILLSVQDLITSKEWNVACLDEAHIIKNRGAKTSAAAMKIQAKNRIMLTGTPVQNHLGELWNLFQFVNPGLLGTYEQFSQKFIIPIEGNKDKDRQQVLDDLVHPFMLRRTKQAVLKELPEKTEIYQPVELSREEMAIYESIRSKAENMLNGNDSNVTMNVLAEITRLRQAACCAELIESKWKGDSSKITMLTELLQGVIEGGNRALVFSQFVGFFDIIKRELDHLGMDYYYIDGSVPVKKRSEMVNEFQNGNKSIFLISLKAGGLGLNLTGANYVFHLDPWWNPAIEQQATDRVYRIGQTQAVTVYHLVSQHTIEEKIIRLHESKRELAENILAGTDISHKLTGKDLLEMIRR